MTPPPPLSRPRSDRLLHGVFWFALLAGFLLRIAYLTEIQANPDFLHPGIDAQFQDYWARALITGNWTPPNGLPDPEVPSHPFFRPPGYPYFLAAIYSLSKCNYLWSRWIQMMIGLLCAVLAFCIGKHAFGSRVGLLWGSMLSLYWVFPYYESQYLEPVLLVFIGVIILGYMYSWTVQPRARHLLISGVLWGAYALVRPNVLLFIPVFAGWIFWVARRHGQSPRACWTGWLALGLGLILTIAPTTWRNFRVSGEWVPISTNGGINLLIGNNELSQGIVQSEIPGLGFFGTCFDYPALVDALSRETGTPLSHSQASRLFARKAWDYIRTHPVQTLRRMARKTLLFWGPVEIGHNKEDAVERAHSRVLSRIPGNFSGMFTLFLLGSGWMVGRRFRTAPSPAERPRLDLEWELSVGLWLFIAVYFASHLPFFIAGRYRVPLLPFLMLFGALFLAQAWTWIRLKYGKALLASGIAATALFALVSRNAAGIQPDEGRWHFDRAVALAEQGAVLDAEVEYEEVLRLRPDYSLAHYNLGSLLANQGRRIEAKARFEQTVRLNPAYLPAWLNLGLVSFELGEQDQALAALERFLAAVPAHPAANFFAGQILAARQRPREARKRFETALQADPGNPEILNSLAWLLATTPEDSVRDGAEALRLAQTACRLTAGRHPGSLDTLAAALAENGQFAPAVEHARQALSLLPPNAPESLRTSVLAHEECYRKEQPWREPARF